MTRASSVVAAVGMTGAITATLMGMTGTVAAAETVPTEIPADFVGDHFTYMPGFDYDGDGCYPSVAIGRNGMLNEGLENSGGLEQECHDPSDLRNSNVYVRAKSNNGWTAYLYDMYFQKDQVVEGLDAFGHRHDIEHVVVWVRDGKVRHVSVSEHGDYDTRPVSDVDFVRGSSHAKVVYHKDGGTTHVFRFSQDGEQPENHTGKWHQPDLVSWVKLKPEIRTKLSSKATKEHFGDANLGVIDGAFENNLANAKPDGITFDPEA